MADSQTDILLRSAEAHARAYGGAGLSAAPARKVAVVACMDGRLDPWTLLGLAEGDAHVIRNAGGVLTEDVIRSLAISQNLLGTREVILIQHTDCGLMGITDDEVADRLERETGTRPEWSAHAFSDLEESVRRGIEAIEASPLLPRTVSARGFVYDVETGDLREVA